MSSENLSDNNVRAATINSSGWVVGYAWVGVPSLVVERVSVREVQSLSDKVILSLKVNIEYVN